MGKRKIFDRWTPGSSPWSSWAKPTLFSVMHDEILAMATWTPLLAETARDPTRAVDAGDGTTAVVVELPGADAVAVGVWLARRGFQPVPLFNGCYDVDPPPLVPVLAIVEALIRGSQDLESIAIPPGAPPAFLLDADRLGPDPSAPAAPPGYFDNRSVVFASDVPSGRRLIEHGVARVTVVRQRDRPVGLDLAEILHAWSRAGLTILDAPLGGDSVAPFAIPSAAGWWFAGFRRLVWAWLRLAPNPLGGFGRPPVPERGRSSFG